MKIRISNSFLELLKEQVRYIAKDKPKAAKKFKNEILQNIHLLSN